MFGPSWTDEHGRGAFEDRYYGEWERKGMDARAARAHTLSDSPERRDLDALIAAWRAGLTKVVTIPCRDEYNRRLGPNALLVTDATRADSARYRSEEHTSELQSLMRISYAVFCLKKKK